MYGRAVASIRQAERAASGVAHLILFEPSALFSATGSGPPPSFSRDPNLVYAPHIYTGGFTGGPITRAGVRDRAARGRRARRRARAVRRVGRRPRAAPTRPDDPYFVEHQRLQDEFRAGATLWTWRESCGDPHKVGDLRAGRVPEVWGEFDVDCRDNSVGGHPRRAHRAAAPRLRARRSRAGSPSRAGTTSAASLEASGQAGAEGGRRRRRTGGFPPGRPGRRRAGDRAGPRARPMLLPVPGGGLLITARARGGAWSIRVARLGAAVIGA